MTRSQQLMLLRIIATVVLIIVIEAVGIAGTPRLLLYIAAYLLIGHDILREAWHGIRHGQPFDENFLMSVATLGAFALALYDQSGDYLEAIAVMLFYQIGEFFQGYAVHKSRRDIAALMDIRPDYAHIEVDGALQRVDPEEVEVGQVIIVQPGERVPIDGTVITGSSALNTSALTGESLPREVGVGDEVVSGAINLSGLLRLQTTRDFGSSTASKILELVEEASSRKAKSENLIARFARIYTPIVCYAALAVALLPPLVHILFGGAEWAFAPFEPWVYRALIFLVISCPCALVVSVPLSFFAGIGGASRHGILVKGGNVLESLAKVRTVVMDKTGTLTHGVFEVTAYHDPAEHPHHGGESHLLEYAAMAESASSHPIGLSLMRAYGAEIDRSRIGQVSELSGHGVIAEIDGQQVAVGNDKLMLRVGATPTPCQASGTIVHVAVQGSYIGHIVLGDVVKPSAAEAITGLSRAGVQRTVMLTGDTVAVADEVASAVGIAEVHSGLLPADKVTHVEQLMDEATDGALVAFVGDGINDAPVLTRADVGIAMGALGSDAAIEAADVVLMDDDPLKIAQAIQLAKRCLRIVWQNIVMALGIKGVCLLLGLFGLVDMWLAIFADVGVTVLAVLNAIRAMRVPRS